MGAIKPISTIPLFSQLFDNYKKNWLPIEYHVHIWQVSPQLSCGDTWQVWTWFKWHNIFLQIIIFAIFHHFLHFSFLCYTHKFTTVCKWIREANTHRHCSSNLPVTSVTDLVSIHSIQYIPRNMHTVFALLCVVVVMHWLIFPYPSGLLHWHCGNLTIAPVPAKQPWWIWINTSFEFIMNDYITTTKQSTTKPCAYFLGYTVLGMSRPHQNKNDTKGSFSHWM